LLIIHDMLVSFAFVDMLEYSFMPNGY